MTHIRHRTILRDKSLVTLSPHPANPRFIDLTNAVSGDLVVMGYAGKNKWWCECACGNIVPVTRNHLRNCHTQSCGCRQKRAASTLNRTHGLSKHPLYRAWAGVHNRCYNVRTARYADYGGRGIRVCQRWHHFEHFLTDMGERPAGLSLDRIDNDGNYSCGHCEECLKHGWKPNCQWATRIEQTNNARRNHHISFNGETLTLEQWTRKLGFTSGTLLRRLKHGWSIESAITTPIRPHKPYINQKPEK